MPHQPWFERRWDFGSVRETYGSIINRLSAAAAELRTLTDDIPQESLQLRPQGKWSIKEHIGHLIVLEPLWRSRFMDIQQNREEMTLADIQNRATWEGGFNDIDRSDLLGQFSEERRATIRLLGSMGEPDHSKTSRHPRLGQSFRIIDHAYFVAEHDSHHMACIREIKTAAD